jgi:hypothetical protein
MCLARVGPRYYDLGVNQHYVPQVYLRQWCGKDGHVVRYSCVGPPNAPRLRAESKAPRGICWEHDLYSLPSGGVANGMTGDELESLLAENVEGKIGSIVTTLSERSGTLERSVADRVKWLMQTFVARTPSMIRDLEAEMERWAAEHTPMIESTMARALTPGMRAELGHYLDARMPAVAARAGLAGVAENKFVPMTGWFDGAVQAVQAASVMPMLATLGLDHFPTFDEPVVRWETNGAGLIASFSVSPTVLALVVAEPPRDVGALALRHVVVTLRHRRFAICRSEIPAGVWLREAHSLRPWTGAAPGGE